MGPEYTEEGIQVQTIQVGQTNGCAYLGPVSGFGAVIDGGLSAALISVKNETAARGGNRLAVISSSTDPGPYAHGRVQGEAYRCP